MNKVMLIGNLGKDPELRYTTSGQAVTDLRLATDESFTDKAGVRQKKTEWHTVVVWGKQAENCCTYLAKGRKIHVEGKLQTRSWEKDGVKRSVTEIKATVVTFLDPAPRDSKLAAEGDAAVAALRNGPLPDVPDADEIPFG